MAVRADVTKLLADNWASLPHEDGRPRRMMHFSTFGKDADTQQRIQALGIDLGDCVQTLLERNGYQIVHRDDPKAADAETYRTARVKCSLCGKQLLTIGVSADMTASFSRLAIKSITQLKADCPHE